LELREKGVAVSACHVRYLNPLPERLGEIFKRFKHVLIPEMNLGQLRLLIRGHFLVDAKGLNKVKGQPFMVQEIVEGVRAIMAGRSGAEQVHSPTNKVLPADAANFSNGD